MIRLFKRILNNIDTLVNARNIKSYEKYMDKNNENWRESKCYNHIKHDCNDSCQGCSDCLLAKYYDGRIKHKPSKIIMRYYEIDSLKERLFYDKILNEIMKDKEFIDKVKNKKIFK